MRIAMVVEYDGSRYHGWQRQQRADSVQARVEEALAKVANHPVELVCAGRTDRGVHATRQVVHFDTESVRTDRGWLLGTMTNLPPDISVSWVGEVDAAFHARYSATARSYRYAILNRTTRSANHAGKVTWWYPPLDAERMHEAAQVLIGEHDFSSFRGRDCQAHTTNRFMESIQVHREGQLIYLDITANAFLHHMVRNIVGTLLPIGSGEQPLSYVADVLAALDRDAAGITAPADGLYLVSVRYPEQYSMLAGARLPVFF